MPDLPKLPSDLANKTWKPSGPFQLTAPRSKMTDPQGYEPDPGLVDAIRVALLLRKPLLLTGRPGTGKTQLGEYLAWKMGLEHEKFDAKSTNVARDLFYTYDAIGHFRRQQASLQNGVNPVAPAAASPPLVQPADQGVRPFLAFNGLGKAILRCAKPTLEMRRLLPDLIPAQPRQSVLVIDEIDKAPRDFPNDLLSEIDQKYFRIPELENLKVEAVEEKAPILVITSNSEKNLPAAFLRRCVYYDIPFPGEEALKKIASRRLVELTDRSDAPLLQGAVKEFLKLAGDESRMQHKPGTAELLDWVAALLESGATADTTLDKHRIRETYVAMVKRQDDRKIAEEILGLNTLLPLS
jgi:MoxR-like ATPase